MRPLSGLSWVMICWAFSWLSQKAGWPIWALSWSRPAFLPATSKTVPQRGETAEDFVGRPDLVRGYVGPQGLGEKVKYIADPRVAPGTAWITGANKEHTHARNVVR